MQWINEADLFACNKLMSCTILLQEPFFLLCTMQFELSYSEPNDDEIPYNFSHFNLKYICKLTSAFQVYTDDAVNSIAITWWLRYKLLFSICYSIFFPPPLRSALTNVAGVQFDCNSKSRARQVSSLSTSEVPTMVLQSIQLSYFQAKSILTG